METVPRVLGSLAESLCYPVPFEEVARDAVLSPVLSEHEQEIRRLWSEGHEVHVISLFGEEPSLVSGVGSVSDWSQRSLERSFFEQRGVLYKGDLVRALRHSDIRRRLVSHLGSDVGGEVDPLQLSGRVGLELCGFGLATFSTDGIVLTLMLMGDGCGIIGAGYEEDDDLCADLLSLLDSTGGTLVVRAMSSPLRRLDETRTLFGWAVEDGVLRGLSSGEAFDILCHDETGAVIPPDPRVTCVDVS